MINSNNFFYVMGGAALSLIGVVTIATGLNGSVQANQQHATDIKTLQATQHKEAEKAELERKKADARYRNGCVMLQKQIELGQSVAGVPIGTIVCDVYGLTAKVDTQGLTSDIVRTPDQAVIQERIAQ